MGQSVLKKHASDLLFVPLGGSGEIGMNLNMYHLDGKWIIVDYGAGFAEEYLPGIDMIVPDIEFLREQSDNILGMFITHAHEDHLGAIVHIWENFDFPVYAGPFTAAFLREKMSDAKMHIRPEIIITKPGERVELGPFDIESVQLTHSVPEMHALFIRTAQGNIFHTGDWKLDPDPVAGEVTDTKRLRQLGEEGVTAVVGDSTNVFAPGRSGSEGELLEPITELIQAVDGMAIITTFASNVARLETLLRAAEHTGRRVVMAGRSLWRIYRAGSEAGYFQNLPEPLEDNAMNSFARKDVVAVVTGCQGEPLAAMSKITNDQHRFIKLASGDEVVFSSKIIPGNEKRIHRMINELIRRGIKVHTEAGVDVHVSGHPNREELKHLYGMLCPKTVIPVHGEDMHMQEHAHYAKSECGVKHALRIHNGDVVKISAEDTEPAKIIDKVETGFFGIDGITFLPPDASALKMRRRITKDGCICVALAVDGNEADMTVFAPGLIDPQEDGDILDELKGEIRDALDNAASRTRKNDFAAKAEQGVRNAVRRYIRSELGKSPPILVNFIEL